MEALLSNGAGYMVACSDGTCATQHYSILYKCIHGGGGLIEIKGKEEKIESLKRQLHNEDKTHIFSDKHGKKTIGCKK